MCSVHILTRVTFQRMNKLASNSVNNELALERVGGLSIGMLLDSDDVESLCILLIFF